MTYTKKTGWWFGCHVLCSHILGISSSQLTNSYFSEGWPNHQPDEFFYMHIDSRWWMGKTSINGLSVVTTNQKRMFLKPLIVYFPTSYSIWPACSSADGHDGHASGVRGQRTERCQRCSRDAFRDGFRGPSAGGKKSGGSLKIIGLLEF